MNNFKSVLFSLSLIIAMTIGCTKPANNGDASENKLSKREHSILTVLWQQNSAEYKALCYQAYNIASNKLRDLDMNSGKSLAIITDIDETVLDNSPYNAMQIEKDLDFDKKDWVDWGKQKSAKALPGAVEFFNLADSLGIEVFYISNRYNVQLEETIANLKDLSFPMADSSHVFLKTTTSEKQERRDMVLENHEVVLYMGDNLSDFSQVFDNQSTASRNQSADEMFASFGDKFIVFPNPMYGDWESKGIYENSRSWTDEQKDSIRRAKLISY